MSENDAGFRDLLVESLTQDGILAKIRAQLRAHIYITLENETKVKHDTSHIFDNDYSAIMFLIYDFLNYHDLTYTLSVFEAEADYLNKTLFKNKSDFYNHFYIKPEASMSPLLLQVFQTYKSVYSKNCNNAGPLNSTYKLNPDSKQNFDMMTCSSSGLKDIKDINQTFSTRPHSTFQSIDSNDSLEKEKETLENGNIEVIHSSMSYIDDNTSCDVNKLKEIQKESHDLSTLSSNDVQNVNQTYTSGSQNKQKYNSSMKFSKITSSSPNSARNSLNLIQFEDSINNISAMKLNETLIEIKNIESSDSILINDNDSPDQEISDLIDNSKNISDEPIISSNNKMRNVKHDTKNSISYPSLYLTATNIENTHIETDLLDIDEEICEPNAVNLKKMNEENFEKNTAKGIYTVQNLDSPNLEQNLIGDVSSGNLSLKSDEMQTNM